MAEFVLTSLDQDDLDNLKNEARRVLAKHGGTFHLNGLDAEVEIIRDMWAVPHIYAKTTADLFFAQGFVHAQDRLWQMEVRRRLESGCLAEVFGSGSLAQDEFTRTIGFKRDIRRIYENLNEDYRIAVDSYAAGVNAWIEKHVDRLPIEFSLARHEPAPWEPTDVIGRGMAYNQAGIWPGKLLRARLLATLGRERAEQIDPLDPPVPFELDEELDLSWIGPEATFGHYRFFGYPERVLHSSYIGSNSWAVDTMASSTGAPLHCSDPHMAIGHPSNWYEVHLCGAGFNVIGASAPGSPGVIIGHNAEVAWGLTNASANIQDIFVEEFHPEDPLRYRVGNSWERAELEKHVIAVRGEGSIGLEVRITRHGPIVYSSRDGKYGLSLAWTGLMDDGPPSMFLLALDLDRARSVDEFHETLKKWNAPAMNFVFAGRDGRIRRVTASRFPIRKTGAGILPVPGWNTDYDWAGLSEPDQMPQELGARNHVILSANEKTTTDTSPLQISSEWDPGFRANRIRAFLAERRKVSVEDMAKLQCDVTSLPARELVPYLLAARASSDEEKAGQDLLRGWDYRLTAESAPAALYETTLRRCFFLLFRKKLGDPLFANYLESARAPVVALLNLLAHPDSYWFDEFGDDPIAGRDQLLMQALREGVAECKKKMGEDSAAWRWGKLHTMYLAHGAARTEALKQLFNIGPFEMPGDIHTVNNTGASFRFGHRQVACASYRQVVDLADFDNSRMVHIQGQSGQPESPHFADFVSLYTRGNYHPMLFSREAIESNAEARLVLIPD